ncbi:MAG TPA: hypothetical protein VGA13_05665 [Acidimicrobiales bacterium]
MLVAVTAALVVLPGTSRAWDVTDPPTGVNELCQPDPLQAALEPNTVQHLTCTYGPLVVTPGDNMILFGPVTFESPRADGWITRFEPDLIDLADGQIPPIHEVHLHHGVWLNARSAREASTPFFATGEEKTVSELPAGYGYRTRPTDEWLFNYMLHNLTPNTYEVMVTYRLDWLPLGAQVDTGGDSEPDAPVTAVEPLWFDVVGGIYPIYDAVDPDALYHPDTNPDGLQRGQRRPVGGGPEWGDWQLEDLPVADAVVPLDIAPSGDATVREDNAGFSGGGSTAGQAWRLVWVGGHVHPGGLRDELVVGGCGSVPGPDEVVAFTSDAVLNRDTTPSGERAERDAGEDDFGSWDFLMKATDPDSDTPFEFVLHDDQPVKVRTYYDAANPWYEAMGIMVAWAVPMTSGEATQHEELNGRCDLTRAGAAHPGALTRDPPEHDDRLVFGGPGSGAGPSAPGTPPTDHVDIAAFTYLPDRGVGSTALVAPGSTVTFRNLDAAANIYHSVTTCAAPCNGPWGQSYPLPELGYETGAGFVGGYVGGFDSGELGWGVPHATAAANTDTFTYRVPDGLTAGTQLTYYCRIHPQMRGALIVTED